MEFQSGAVRPIGSIEDGWSLIKDDYWTFFGMTLVAFVIIIILSVLLGVINNVITLGVSAVLGVSTSNAGEVAKISAAILPQLITLFISSFINIFVGAISAALFCGIYTALSRKSNTGIADFGDLFSGFQKFKACLVAAAFFAAVQFVISLIGLFGGAAFGFSALGAGMLTGDGQLNPAVFGGLFLVFAVFAVLYLIFSLILGALTTFTYPLIAERNLSGGEALLVSIKSGFANFGGLILLMILLVLMTIAGALACLIGVLFVAPIMSAAVFAAYRSVFGRTGGNDFNYAPPPPPNFNNQPGY